MRLRRENSVMRAALMKRLHDKTNHSRVVTSIITPKPMPNGCAFYGLAARRPGTSPLGDGYWLNTVPYRSGAAQRTALGANSPFSRKATKTDCATSGVGEIV